MTEGRTSGVKCGQISRAYKTELDPTIEQSRFFSRCVGAARFVWNWSLAKRNEVDVAKDSVPSLKIPTSKDLHRQLVRAKQGELAWLYEVPKDVAQETLRELEQAFKSLFESHMGRPKFKVKKWAKRTFTISGTKIRVADNAIRLPLIGWVKLKERGYLLPEGPVHLLSATVSEVAGRWCVSVNVREGTKPVRVPKIAPVVGIDFGIGGKNWITLSDGSSIESPRALRNNERKLKRLQSAVSQKREGSKNQQKARQRVARQHVKIADIRKDAIEKATTWLAKLKRVYVVEDLNAVGMMRNHRLAKSVADASMSATVRRLEQKAPWYGSRVVKAGRLFPSTKRCSKCGNVKAKMLLSVRWYACERCGFEADRDYNAALNLQQWPSVRGTLEVPATGSQNSAGISGRRAEMSYSSIN